MRFKLLILTGIVLLTIQLAGAAINGPVAGFQTQGTEWVYTDSNDFYNGTYLAQYGYSVSILNIADSSRTVLGNITYSMDMDNILEYDKPFTTRNGSRIRWTFPANISIPENRYLLRSARSDFIYPRYIPITIHRQVNNSRFSSDGDQLVTYSFTYDNFSLADANLTCSGIMGSFTTTENSVINATLLPDTFRADFPTDNSSMQQRNAHTVEFSAQRTGLTPVQTDTLYNVSIVVHIDIKETGNNTIQYYPRFSTALVAGNTSFNNSLLKTAKTPSFMLPAHVRSATGSTNISNKWSYVFYFLRGARLNETFQAIPPVSATKVGVFRPSNHTFYLKNGTRITSILFGQKTDLPVTGDWNGDGKWDVGVFRPSNRTFYLKIGTKSTGITFGQNKDIPVTGDWNGDGKWDVGVFNKSTHRFLLKNGTKITSISFGSAPDIPISGDWNEDGMWDVGVFNKSAHRFLLKNGTTNTIVTFGLSTDIPVTGDWNADSISDVGVFRPANQTFYLKNGTRTTTVTYGTSTDIPITGKWS